MNAEHKENNGQATFWNGAAGRGWIEAQDLLDCMFQPVEDLLVRAVRDEAAQRVLDVGCGTGSTTLAIARQLGSQGCCIGVDISEPMIATARSRAERERSAASFVCGDAQRQAFEPDSFDMIVSRFGVMFFDDPAAAFANLRQAASDNAKLQFFAWRSPEENPFMTTAERAAAKLLPTLPVRRPDEPGQFAFANRNRVHGILQAAGWSAIEIEPADIACAFPAEGLVRYLTQVGPLGRALQGADEQTRQQVVDTVRTAFAPYVQGNAVRFNAACWKVDARARPVPAV